MAAKVSIDGTPEDLRSPELSSPPRPAGGWPALCRLLRMPCSSWKFCGCCWSVAQASACCWMAAAIACCDSAC